MRTAYFEVENIQTKIGGLEGRPRFYGKNRCSVYFYRKYYKKSNPAFGKGLWMDNCVRVYSYILNIIFIQ